MTRKNLEHHKASQCHVELESDGTIRFISYTTLVIEAFPYKTEEGRTLYTLYCTGTYSRTTGKQIGWFLKEYFGDVTYQEIKNIAGDPDSFITAERKTAKYW